MIGQMKRNEWKDNEIETGMLYKEMTEVDQKLYCNKGSPGVSKA